MGWSQIRWAVAIATMVAVSIGVAVAIHMASSSADRLSRSDADRVDLRAQLAEQEKSTGLLADQLKALGETPVVQPHSTTPPQIQYIPVPGKDGSNGRPGLPGLPGSPGASVTGPAGESVTGATGPTGLPGTDGKDGAAGRDGTNGKDGSNGSPGADGRGITSLTCTGIFAPITFTTTYTDGTTAEFTCGTIPDPAPAD